MSDTLDCVRWSRVGSPSPEGCCAVACWTQSLPKDSRGVSVVATSPWAALTTSTDKTGADNVIHNAKLSQGHTDRKEGISEIHPQVNWSQSFCFIGFFVEDSRFVTVRLRAAGANKDGQKPTEPSLRRRLRAFFSRRRSRFKVRPRAQDH